jgi:hypothetical protein
MSYLLHVANERPMLRIGHDHSGICLCGAVRIVIFWGGGLRRALTHSLIAVALATNRQIQHAF